MAEKPYKITDRRSSSGYRSDFIEPMSYRAQADRRQWNNYAVDSRELSGTYTRKGLSSLARWLVQNSSTVRGSIAEMVTYSVSSWIPQFDGQDKAWGAKAEEWLYEHDKILDVRGWPYSRTTWLRNLVQSSIVDGDTATLFVETADGYPQLQVIPSHRIEDRIGGLIEEGEYAGYTAHDGVVLNSVGGAAAYVVCGSTPEEDRFIAEQNMMLHYSPTASDQVRGLSWLGASMMDWQDVKDTRSWEKIAQKIGASIGIIEHNETGTVDPTRQLVSSTMSNGRGQAPAVDTREVISEGGEVRYFKAGSNSKLESFRQDRPSQNQREFEDGIIRSALHSIGWSFDFSVNPTKAGGAQMRVVVEKINRNLDSIRQVIIEPACRRLDGWRIAKAMKLGLLPWSDDWYRWKYQGPARLTADEKYSSDVSLQELNRGLTTYEIECGKRGEWWEDVLRQKARERATFERICAEEGVEPENVILLTPNGNPTTGADNQQQQQQQPQD